MSPANPGYTVDELAFQLKDSGAKALVTQVPQLEIAVQACKKVGIPEDQIIVMGERDTQGKFRHWTSIRNISGATRYRRAKVDPANDLAFLVYSSGTTGKPKGVMLTHRNIVANTLQITAGEGPISGQPREGLPEGDSVLAFLPFFHIYGLTVILHQSFYRGVKTVVMSKFDIESWCRIVQEHKITFAYVVPPVVLQLSKHPCVDKYDLSSIRMLNSGAAPLTRELVNAVYSRIKVPVKQGYGLSETSPTTHTQPWEDWERSIGSVGTMLPNQTAKYVSAEEKEVPTGEVGELWIKGPNVFKGYLNNPEGTKNALTEDGFFKTGDVGYQDKDGIFFITDRVKELIKYKGFQVRHTPKTPHHSCTQPLSLTQSTPVGPSRRARRPPSLQPTHRRRRGPRRLQRRPSDRSPARVRQAPAGSHAQPAAGEGDYGLVGESGGAS